MPHDRVFRIQSIDGLLMPVFIHNWDFHFIDMPVYADGLVDCWEMVDLPLFREKLKSGWVTPSAPNGAQVSVHGLGAWRIGSARWDLDATALYAKVEGMLRELNPEMENLHDCHGTTVKLVGKVRVSIHGMPKKQAVRIVSPEKALPVRVPGDALSTFVHDGDYHLASLRVFKDGVIELGRLATSETLDLDSLRRAVETGRVVASLPPGAQVRIHGLGSFVAETEQWSTNAQEQFREVSDLVDLLNSRPGSIDRCRAAYQSYLQEPTVARRDALREAYEAVPEHNRMYIGDMDTKDVAVRMILFGEQEIENWSHRAVARARGDAVLPVIRVPKPKE